MRYHKLFATLLQGTFTDQISLCGVATMRMLMDAQYAATLLLQSMPLRSCRITFTIDAYWSRAFLQRRNDNV